METVKNDFLPNVKFEAIPIKDLVTNQQYQRNLSEKHVRRAISNFDVYQINPVKVSRRNGINYVFNGQHTIEIVAGISGSREASVWCMVYEDLNYEHEANIFANQQKYVKALTPYEIFVANIEAGNDKQILINDLVESYNLKIVPVCKPCGICAVSALEFIYDRYGHEVLSRTLRLVIGAWEGDQKSLGASVLKGIAKNIVVFQTELKDELFIEKLGSVSVKEIIRTAKERGSGAMGYAEAILAIYNKKRANPLPTSQLYNRVLPKVPSSSEDALIEAFDHEANSQTVDSVAVDHGMLANYYLFQKEDNQETNLIYQQ